MLVGCAKTLNNLTALTGFDAEHLGFGTHLVGSVAQGSDVRGDFDGHHTEGNVIIWFAQHFLPVLWTNTQTETVNVMEDVVTRLSLKWQQGWRQRGGSSHNLKPSALSRYKAFQCKNTERSCLNTLNSSNYYPLLSSYVFFLCTNMTKIIWSEWWTIRRAIIYLR